MNIFLISFTSRTNVLNRTDLQNFFDSRVEILNWFGIMPEAILVVTEISNTELSNLIRNKFSVDITFLITKADKLNTTGFINKEVWDFIMSPEPSSRNLQNIISDSKSLKDLANNR